MKPEDMKMADIEARRAEITARRAEIDTEAPNAEGDALDALEAEVRSLNDEETALEERAAAILKAAEERAAKVAEVISTGKESRKITTEEVKTMEVRNTDEYKAAFNKAVVNGDDREARALLSNNATNGAIPVPSYIGDRIRTAWENDQIMGRVKRTYLRGNVQVGFEDTATGAAVHDEGDETGPAEEEITMGVVDLTAKSVKKWITVSDEALDLNETTADYIYDEVTYRIVKAAAGLAVTAIKNAPDAAGNGAPAAAKVTAAPGLSTVAQGIAALSGEAVNPVVIINKLTWGDFKAAQAAGGYNYDPFEGCEVLFTDALKAYSAASSGEVWGLVGDLAVGVQANFPNGDEVTVKRDDLSLAELDLVKFVGREFVGIGYVAPFAFAKLAKA